MARYFSTANNLMLKVEGILLIIFFVARGQKGELVLPGRKACILLIEMFKSLGCLRLERRFSGQALKDDSTKAPKVGL